MKIPHSGEGSNPLEGDPAEYLTDEMLAELIDDYLADEDDEDEDGISYLHQVFHYILEDTTPIIEVSDDDEMLMKHVAYSMLALLWDKKAVTDNIDYHNPGVPFDLFEASEENPAILDDYYAKQAEVLTAQWESVRRVMHAHGKLNYLNAMFNRAENFSPAWYVATRWDDAVAVYGPHPDGIHLHEETYTCEEGHTHSFFIASMGN